MSQVTYYANVLPGADDAYDLGGAAQRFANIYGAIITTPDLEAVLVSINATGTVKANNDLLTICNTGNAADMDGTITSIRWDQWYYNATTPAIADAARISVGTEQDWSSTASTQDAYMAFSVALDGTITEWMRITSAGKVGINNTAPTAHLQVTPTAVGNIGIISRGMSGQTGNLYEARNTSDAILFVVTKDGALVVNEQGADADTRFEGDTNANLFYLDASTDRIGIGTSGPGTLLDVNGVFTSQQGSIINESGADSDTRIEGDTVPWLFYVDASADKVGISCTAPSVLFSVAQTSGHTAEGGFAVRLTNKTGGASVKGQLVMAASGTNMAFQTAAANEDQPIGVAYESGIADGGECWVVVGGIAEVLLKDSTTATHGNWAYSSDTAGRADMTNADPPGVTEHTREIGHCIESKAAGTDVLARIVMHFN